MVDVGRDHQGADPTSVRAGTLVERADVEGDTKLNLQMARSDGCGLVTEEDDAHALDPGVVADAQVLARPEGLPVLDVGVEALIRLRAAVPIPDKFEHKARPDDARAILIIRRVAMDAASGEGSAAIRPGVQADSCVVQDGTVRQDRRACDQHATTRLRNRGGALKVSTVQTRCEKRRHHAPAAQRWPECLSRPMPLRHRPECRRRHLMRNCCRGHSWSTRRRLEM